MQSNKLTVTSHVFKSGFRNIFRSILSFQHLTSGIISAAKILYQGLQGRSNVNNFSHARYRRYNISRLLSLYSLLIKFIEIRELIHVLNSRIFNEELADEFVGHLQNEDYDIEDYFYIISLSKKNKALSVAASNAATILNYAGVAFSGRDLSGARIPHADLSYGILHRTVLRNCAMEGVKLFYAFLDASDFRGVDVDKVGFKEGVGRHFVGLNSY